MAKRLKSPTKRFTLRTNPTSTFVSSSHVTVPSFAANVTKPTPSAGPATEPGGLSNTYYDLGKAQNWNQFRDILKKVWGPAQNVVTQTSTATSAT